MLRSMLSRAVPVSWSLDRLGESPVERMLATADVRIDGARPWDIRVHRPRFFRRILTGGDLGFGESYMDGDWDCERIDEMAARLFTADLHHAVGRTWDAVDNFIARVAVRHTQAGVRRAVAPHYDLGNDLF